jgi:sulfur relay (sulfurtransferase) DsrC/TusE family protein
MATFEARVEGLTGLSIDGSSAPTQDELTEFLKDGVLDVTERIVALRPEQASDFVRISSASSTQGALSSHSGKIISVLRESGTNDDWRPARRISIDKQSRVTDSSSLEYATAYNPVYMMSEDGAVLVFPAPASSSTQYKIYYVNGTPTDVTNGASLAYSHSDIKYFPESKVYLVVLYAACQSLLNKLSSYTISQTVPSLSLPSAPVPPSAPSFTTPTIGAITVESTTVSNVGAPPTYTAPSVASDSSNVELTALTSLDTENVIDDFDGNAIEFDQWFQTAAHLIEDEEDVELANAQLQKIRTYIEAYSAEMQNKLNSFNKQNVEYQGKLQESIQQAQLDAQKAIQQSQLDSADAQQETALLLQKENQEYAAKLQQFSADVGKYSAEVQAKVQDHAAQINEIGAEIQIDSTEYTWMSQRYAALKGQYDQAFGLMAPKEGEN